MKKLLLTSTIITIVIIFSIFIFKTGPTYAAYTPKAGDLIKTANDPAIYYISNENGIFKRHLFPNAVTFWTWHSGNWSDQNIITISQNDFDNSEIFGGSSTGNNITARPGVNLIKFQNSSKIYAVSPGNILNLIDNESAGLALYGNDWENKIITIQNGFENNYTKSDVTFTDHDKLPDGSLIKYKNSNDVYYILGRKKHLLTNQALSDNYFKESSIIKNIDSSMIFEAGNEIRGFDNSTNIPCSLSGICPMIIKDIKLITKISPSDMRGISLYILAPYYKPGTELVNSLLGLGDFLENNSGDLNGIWTDRPSLNSSGPVLVAINCNNTNCIRPAYNIKFLDENNIERNIYIPASNNNNNASNSDYYWVATDGSTYYANKERGRGLPNLTHDIAFDYNYPPIRPVPSVEVDWKIYSNAGISSTFPDTSLTTKNQIQQAIDLKNQELAKVKVNYAIAQHEQAAMGSGYYNLESYVSKISILEKEIADLKIQIISSN